MRKAVLAGWTAFRKNTPALVKIGQGQYAQIQNSVLQNSSLKDFVWTGEHISELEKSLGLSRAEVIEAQQLECAKRLDKAAANLHRWYVPGKISVGAMAIAPMLVIVHGPPYWACEFWMSLGVGGGIMAMQLLDRRLEVRSALKAKLAMEFHERRLLE